ncbi:MAG TPA: hypothetical protein PLA68_05335 [Panacibacter sp.]|nr:hypothetical protein [Panacibacter sp.]
MRRLVFIALIMHFMFSSCRQPGADNNTKNITRKDTSTESTEMAALPFLDTAIVIFGSGDQPIRNVKVTNRQAKTYLYKYFKRKDILPREEINAKTDNAGDRLCVSYDTVYNIHTKNNSGAIVSYWLGPADLNGHCFQPSKAVIQKINNEYTISNEDFIPSNFAIDSSSGSFLYGYDYDCGGGSILRGFRITLK